MDSSQESITVSPPPVSIANLKQRPPPSWVPFGGTKRKAHAAGLSDEYDIDCRPSPAKQFAVDEDVAGDILQDGFYFDPANPPANVETKAPLAPVEEDIEIDELPDAENAAGEYMKYLGDSIAVNCVQIPACDSMTKPGVGPNGTEIKDEKKLNETLSMLEINPVTKQNSFPINCSSLILSNEIQETLIRKRLNEDFILPKSIMNQFPVVDNSMALVPWTPPRNLTILETSNQQTEGNLLLPEPSIPLPISTVATAEIPTPEDPVNFLLEPSLDEDSMDVDDL